MGATRQVGRAVVTTLVRARRLLGRHGASVLDGAGLLAGGRATANARREADEHAALLDAIAALEQRLREAPRAAPVRRSA
jgi:hypothetical protein